MARRRKLKLSNLIFIVIFLLLIFFKKDYKQILKPGLGFLETNSIFRDGLDLGKEFSKTIQNEVLDELVLGDLFEEKSEHVTNKYFSYQDVLDAKIEYVGEEYQEINNNIPFFTKEEIEENTKMSFEAYSELDFLGRCGVAFANLGKDLMPTKKRESISEVRPTGFINKKYEGVVDGDMLYNRCHLIAYSLSGEGTNPKNLITGTRSFNVVGMLPFEHEVLRYIKETNNHVLYRVSPIFKEEELVARGVLMEAYSVEDEGEGVSFCVYVFNVQEGIEIDYLTGESYLISRGEYE